MNKTTTREIKTKSGITIAKGEKVTVAFDTGKDSLFSLTTTDGRRALSRDTTCIGIRVPTVATLEKWNDEGVCKTIFGERTEPDGHGPSGAPSWLLFMGMI